jgi:hypothetical protein
MQGGDVAIQTATVSSADGPVSISAFNQVVIENSTVTGQTGVTVAGATQPDGESAEFAFVAIKESTVEARTGDVNIVNNRAATEKTPDGIFIFNSSQLRALAGNIHLLTQGSDIDVVGSSLVADGGAEGQGNITAVSNGGSIRLSGATLTAARQILLDMGTAGTVPGAGVRIADGSVLNADVIKARAFGTSNADALVVDSSILNADTLVRLFAEGSSKLLFRGAVELNAPSSQLAGKIVEVSRGGSVMNNRGSITVFATGHHYYIPGVDAVDPNFGTINASGGVTKNDFVVRPDF